MLRKLVGRLPNPRRVSALFISLVSVLATVLAWQAARGLWCGMAFSLLLCVIAWLWGTRHGAAQALASEMSSAPQESEERLRQTRDELAWKAQRRMDELGLTNQVLQEEIARRIQAEIRLEAKIQQLNHVNADLNDFAYIVSHDLRAPLRAIGSLAHWITEDNAAVLNDEGRENLETLMNRVRRMDGLIQGILQYSRIGRLTPTREYLDSDEVAREVVDSLAPPPGITARVEGTLPRICYDRTHLQQLFQNLIGNAIKHLGKPQGEIVVFCSDAKDCWEFAVRDTGVGIDNKHFERIFKIFQTLKPRDEVEASGIGLSIVKAIAEKHGGRVRVESTVGRGATFYFTIPKQQESPGEDAAVPWCGSGGELVLSTPSNEVA